MQGERKPCKGAKGVRGQLEGGCLQVSAAAVRVSRGFLRVSDRRLKRCQKIAVWVGLGRLCHAAKTKKEYKGDLEPI